MKNAPNISPGLLVFGSLGRTLIFFSLLYGISLLFSAFQGTPFFLLFCPFLSSDLWGFGRDEKQEPRKGGFSKGGFCRVQCHAQGSKKYPSILGPAVHLALAKTGVHFCKNPLQ